MAGLEVKYSFKPLRRFLDTGGRRNIHVCVPLDLLANTLLVVIKHADKPSYNLWQTSDCRVMYMYIYMYTCISLCCNVYHIPLLDMHFYIYM